MAGSKLVKLVTADYSNVLMTVVVSTGSEAQRLKSCDIFESDEPMSTEA